MKTKLLLLIKNQSLKNIVLAVCFFLISSSAMASHFRYGDISWRIDENDPTGRTIIFKANTGWACCPGVSLSYNGTSSGYIGSVPQNLTGNANGAQYYSGEVSYTFPANGTYKVWYSGGNKIGGLSNNANGRWYVYTTVNVGTENNSPVTSLPAIVNLQVGTNSNFNIPVADPDGDAVTYRLATSADGWPGTHPSGLSVSSNGQVSWNTNSTSIGQLWNTAVVIRDSQGAEILVDFIIQITQQSNPPQYDYSITPADGFAYQSSPGQTISFPIEAFDTDPGSTVSITASGMPSGASVSPSFGTAANPINHIFNWTPTASQFGQFLINFIAQDNNGVQVSTSVSINVSLKPVFDVPPTPVSGVHNTIVSPGTLIQYNVQASDPDPLDVVQIIAAEGKDMMGMHIPLYTGATFSPLPTTAANPTSGTFNWTPTQAQWGHRHVFFTAQDSYGDQTVHEVNQLVNTPPIFASQPILTADVGVPYSYTIQVIDPDLDYGDELTIFGNSLPAWLSVNDNGDGTATLTGTPSVSEVGVNIINLQAEDKHHHDDIRGIIFQNFDINVNNCTINVLTIDKTIQLDASGNTSITITDINNSSTASCGIASISLSKTAFNCSDIGTNTVTLTVTDNNNNVSTATANVTVQDNTAPTLVGIPGDITVECNIVPTIPTITATDNCSTNPLVTVNEERTDGFSNNNYTLARTWSTTDENGNTTSETQIITVQDTSLPTAIAKDITVELDASGNASITTDMVNDGSYDNCGEVILSLNKTNFDCNDFSVSCSDSSISFNGTGIASGANGDNIQNLGLNQLTMEAWVKPNNSSINSIIRKAGDYDLYINNNTLYAEVWYEGRASSAQYLYSGPTVSTNEWSHLAFTFDKANNGSGKFYVNGVETIVSGTTRSIAPDITLGIGGSTEYGQSFNGLIDDVRIWSNERTNAEINEFKDFCIDANSVGLEAYFKIEANEGTILTDYSGNGNHLTITGTSWSFEGAPIESKAIEVTLTVTDSSNNTSSAIANIIVIDPIAPTVVGQNISVTLTASGTVSIVPEDVLDNGSDNCGPVTYTVSQDTFGATDAINSPVTVQLTGTDASGNATTVPVLVTVIDPVPVVVTQDISVELDANGTITIDPSQIDNGSSSVVGLSGLALDISSFDCSNIGTPVTVTLTATSTLGSTATGTAIVTLQDNTAPIAISQNITVQLDENGAVSIMPEDINNGSSDACGIQSLILDTTSFNCNDIGDNTVTLTVTDNNNNVSTATATVNVQDNIAPTPITQDITIQLDTFGNASIVPSDVDNGSFDNCAIDTMTLDISDFSCNNIGENTVTLTVSDAANNTGTIIPSNLVGHWKFDSGNELVDLTGNWGDLIVSGTASISNGELDVNNGGMARTSSYNGATIGNKTLVSYVSLDNLNLRSGSAITIDAINSDKFDGIIYAEQQANRWMNGSSYFRRTQPLNPGFVETSANQKIMVAITYEQVNTSQVKVSFYRNGVPYGSYVSNNYRTWTAGDAEILFGARHFIGTSQIGALDAHIDEAMIFDKTLTGAEILALYGNDDSQTSTTSATAIVTVQDNIAPTAIAQDIIIQLDALGNASIVPSDVDNGSNDACGVSLALSQLDFDCSHLGDNIVTLIVTDNNTNVSTIDATVTVIDNIAPTAITQDITVQLDVNGEATIVPSDVDNGSNDACPITLSLDTTSFDCSNVGSVNTVTLTVRDASGNTNATTATVTVIDSVPAEVITQNIDVFLDENGATSIVPADIDNGSNDACGIESVVLDITNFDCANLGENTVVLTVTDVNGNVSSNEAIVTVIDNIAPIVGTQSVSVTLDAFGNASITPEDVLILTEDDVERGDICTVSDADEHAMCLNDYNKGGSKKNSKNRCNNGGHGHHNEDACFSFDANQGSVIKNLDGSMIVTGTLVNPEDANDIWEVTLNLQNPKNWTDWSAQKGKYKGSKKTIRYSYKDWMYFQMAEGSKLTGAGANVGLETLLTQKYGKYGVQIGDNANLENGNYGLFASFYYINKNGKKEQGEFSFDISNCEQLPIPEGTVISSDNCSIASTSLDIDTFGCDNLGENTVQVSVTDQSGNTTTQSVIVNVLGDTPVISIDDFYTANGQKKNTVFLGYSDSTYLKTEVSGGSGFSYEWTNQEGTVISTDKNPKVSPEITSTYTVVVTNSNGCQATDSIEVCVIDARAKDRHGRFNDKVIICHHTAHKHNRSCGHNGHNDDDDDDHQSSSHNNHQSKDKLITVSRNAVKGHLKHGDVLGGCEATCATEVYVEPEIVTDVNIYPNPSTGYFYVKLENFENKAVVLLYTIQGRLIEYKYVKDCKKQDKVKMGSSRLREGIYVVKIRTGGEVFTGSVIIERSNRH